MTTFVLNKDKPLSESFTFKGDCCICAKGSGTFQILRKMENEYTPITDSNGSLIEYACNDGIAFNGHISCGVRCEYRIRATGSINITVRVEK